MEKRFFQVEEQCSFFKIQKELKNNRDIRYQVCNNRSKKELFGIRTKPSYNKRFFRKFISHRNEKILMNELVYLGLRIFEISKIVMYEFLYDYVNPKYGEKAKLCFIDTDSFLVYIKTDHILALKSAELNQLEREINYLEKYKLTVGSQEKIIKKFIKINKLILKSQQSFTSEKHNVFIGEVNKTALTAIDD